jgi:hypothetical protein
VRLGEARPLRDRAGRDVAEVLLRPREHLRDVDVADHREDGVARRVVAVEELLASCSVELSRSTKSP